LTVEILSFAPRIRRRSPWRTFDSPDFSCDISWLSCKVSYQAIHVVFYSILHAKTRRTGFVQTKFLSSSLSFCAIDTYLHMKIRGVKLESMTRIDF
jgi:hypothetical protein